MHVWNIGSPLCSHIQMEQTFIPKCIVFKKRCASLSNRKELRWGMIFTAKEVRNSHIICAQGRRTGVFTVSLIKHRYGGHKLTNQRNSKSKALVANQRNQGKHNQK